MVMMLACVSYWSICRSSVVAFQIALPTTRILLPDDAPGELTLAT
jgi:hypothetical protein